MHYFELIFWTFTGLIIGSFVNVCVDRIPIQFSKKKISSCFFAQYDIESIFALYDIESLSHKVYGVFFAQYDIVSIFALCDIVSFSH